MRRTVGILFAFGLGGSAWAADLPPSPAPARAPAAYVPAVLPVYNWSGIYVGINGGWGWGNAKWTADAVNTFPGATGSVHDNGGVVGGTLAPISRPAPLCSALRATGIIPALIPERLPASALSVAIAKPAIIGWRPCAGAPAMPPIASCFI